MPRLLGVRLWGAQPKNGRAGKAEAWLQELLDSCDGESSDIVLAASPRGWFLTALVSLCYLWQRWVGTASDNHAAAREELLEVKEELADACVDLGAWQAFLRHGQGDEGELVEHLHAVPQQVDELISDGVFLDAHAMLTVAASLYDNGDLAVVGGGCNLLGSEGKILALGEATAPHALLLADDIASSIVISCRNDLPHCCLFSFATCVLKFWVLAW